MLSDTAVGAGPEPKLRDQIRWRPHDLVRIALVFGSPDEIVRLALPKRGDPSPGESGKLAQGG